MSRLMTPASVAVRGVVSVCRSETSLDLEAKGRYTERTLPGRWMASRLPGGINALPHWSWERGEGVAGRIKEGFWWRGLRVRQNGGSLHCHRQAMARKLLRLNGLLDGAHSANCAGGHAPNSMSYFCPSGPGPPSRMLNLLGQMQRAARTKVASRRSAPQKHARRRQSKRRTFFHRWRC